MPKVAITEQYLEDIADAIREKTGLSSTYYPSEMAPAILTISGGGGITPTGTININTNGTHNVTTYASANVQVPNSYTSSDEGKVVSSGALVAQTSATYTTNNTYDTTLINSVTVNVSGGGGSPVIQSLSVTPSTSEQTFNSSSVDGYKPVVVSAMPAGSATGPSSLSGSSATISTGTNTITLTKTGVNTTPTVSAGYVASATSSTATVALTASVTTNPTPTASGKTVTIPAGYYSAQTTKDVDTMTLPTSASASATSGYTSKATISRSTSDQYINIPTGYNTAGAYYKINAVANGSATGPSSLSGTSATVSTGTNTITLTKTGITTTPTVSAGYVSSATASTATVALTASVTTKAAATITPTTSNQTIASGTYLTGTQTISGDANLVAGNIKKNVSIFGVTGSYEGGGGGGGLTVATATSTLSSAGSSISFTGLAGEPTSFAVVSASELATGASPWKTAAVVFDGTDLHGQTIRNTSNAQVSYDGSSFSKTYSSGTLTITGSGTNFQANEYKLVYTYGGSDIGTADVQVGSGATSITFTDIDDEPSYFSCIFKSNFSTSSGYQRVIVVVYDGTSTYGMEMDSSAKPSTAHWSYSYNNGSLTITSQGTNAGGYFHQPGYYQLTYANEGGSGNYQNKTVYATSSQQTVTADSGYDALKKVTVAAVTTTNLTASNILSGVTIQVGDAADSDRIASVTGNVVLQNYYTGSSAPSSSLGSNGDLYLQS